MNRYISRLTFPFIVSVPLLVTYSCNSTEDPDPTPDPIKKVETIEIKSMAVSNVGTSLETLQFIPNKVNASAESYMSIEGGDLIIKYRGDLNAPTIEKILHSSGGIRYKNSVRDTFDIMNLEGELVRRYIMLPGNETIDPQSENLGQAHPKGAGGGQDPAERMAKLHINERFRNPYAD